MYEYVEGGDLAACLSRIFHERGRGLTPDPALKAIRQITEALAFAHDHGLVHRDLKPANVLVSGETIKLADFGIGAVAAGHARKNSRIGTSAVHQLSLADRMSLYRGAGTPLYMSPEQRRGAAPDPRHDLYSLGVMWYQMLVGDVTREFAQGWDDELAEKYHIPQEHVALIKLCTGLVEKRPTNARELLKALPSVAVPSTPPEPPTETRTAEDSAIPSVLPVDRATPRRIKSVQDRPRQHSRVVQKEEPDEEEEERPQWRRKRQREGQWADCPNCRAPGNATRIWWPLWGLLPGAAIICHVRCNECGRTYNGNTGHYNTAAINISVVVSVILALALPFLAIVLSQMK